MPSRYCHACNAIHPHNTRCPAQRTWGGRRTQRTRTHILARDQCTCQHCGATLPPSQLHVDHITPRAMGGTDHPANLQTLCAPCNLRKGNA